MIKKDIWSISLARSGVGFKYGYEDFPGLQGIFTGFSGMVLADKDFRSLDLMLYLEAETLTAVDQDTSRLLTSEVFFDAAQHPFFLLHSGRVTQTGDSRHIDLELTLKGIVRPVRLMIFKARPFLEDPQHNALLSGKLVISASDFRFGTREWHDPDQEITIEVQLFLTRPKDDTGV